MIFIYLIFVYFILIFVGIRLIVPYYGFKQSKDIVEMPEYFMKDIEEINLASKDNFGYLEKSYNYLSDKYYGSKTELFTRWQRAFDDIFVHKTGFIPCNVFNELLRTMLIKSGRFEDKDIKKRVTILNFFIHQYLQVKVNNKWVDVDLEYKKMGVPFGKHASIFW